MTGQMTGPAGAPWIARLGPEMLALTGSDNWFEDFPVGRRLRHARGATMDALENAYLSKAVMNTAEPHWNEHALAADGPLGAGRVVFGLLTASLVVGLSSQDTAENALAELGMDKVRFRGPVHHGDTVYALTEVMQAVAADRPDAGRVRFAHWGLTHDERLVVELERTVLIKRRSHWGSPGAREAAR
jgi:acyl dehydratase